MTLPKPMTSGAKSDGRFGKQDFVYSAAEGLSLSCWREADLSHDERAGRQDDAALLDERLPELPAEVEMYDRQRAAHSTLGSMSTSSKQRRDGSMKIRRRCVHAARRSSIRSAR